MKQLSRILSLGVIALLISSCSPSEKEESKGKARQQSESKVSRTTSSPKEPAFTGATQPSKPASERIAVAGLIPSTNPDRRRQELERGRNNPFALIPVQPTLKQSQSKTAVSSPATVPKPVFAPKPSAARKRIAVKPNPYPAYFPPPLPLPQIAREVVVFGVIQIDGTPQVIVKAPNEQFSRYVQPGQFLANGQVRVKRIEGLGSPDPIVVLEELGQEVYKQVGEGIPQPTDGEAAAAFLPDLEQG